VVPWYSSVTTGSTPEPLITAYHRITIRSSVLITVSSMARCSS
jgi:hypothetical protein